MRRSLIQTAVLMAVLPLGPPVRAAERPPSLPCSDYRADAFCGGTNVVWCGAEELLDIDRLARHAAPILWFSPDEPLLPLPLDTGKENQRGERPRVFLPHELQVVDPDHCHPQDRARCDNDARGAYVYYRINRLEVRDGQQQNVDARLHAGQLFLPGIKTLTLAYFFYYEQDEGLNPHYNDTEGVELDIDFGREQSKRNARVARATGLGHGSQLLSNILQIKGTVRQRAGAPDVTLPITVLVEEGKHASAPDRNGDGTYTPGYDVNVKVADAWGVRDVFGSGVISSRYHESMTKPRNPADRVGPAADWFWEQYGPRIKAPAQCYATRAGLLLPNHTYQLKAVPRCEPGNVDPFCMAATTLASKRPPDQKFYQTDCLQGPVKHIEEQKQAEGERPPTKKITCNYLNMAHVQEDFGRAPEVTGFHLKYLYGRHWWLQPLRFLALAVRTEGTAVGPQIDFFSTYGIPKLGGWFTGRAALLRDRGEWHWRTDISHTPSLARLADWYAGVGYDWGVTVHRVPKDLFRPPERVNGWAAEAGVQVRHTAKWLRVGARFDLGGLRFSQARAVAELGYGPQPRHARVH